MPDTPETDVGYRHPLSKVLSPANLRSIPLENRGSVARDHLANERTFLAWLRTSLSFITMGIGITQLFRLESSSSRVQILDRYINLETEPNLHAVHRYGKPVGAVFIGLGIFTVAFGAFRFFLVQYTLTQDHYPATRLSVGLLSSIILALSVAVFAMILKTAT